MLLSGYACVKSVRLPVPLHRTMQARINFYAILPQSKRPDLTRIWSCYPLCAACLAASCNDLLRGNENLMTTRWRRCQQGYTTCHRDDRGPKTNVTSKLSPEPFLSESDLDGHGHGIGWKSYGTCVRQSVGTFCGLALNIFGNFDMSRSQHQLRTT